MEIWNNGDDQKYYMENEELHKQHILDQYKLYVEMADRISSRRNSANIFFLTLNSTVLTVIGFLFEKVPVINPRWLISFPLLGILIVCIVWFWMIVSYKKLNAVKFAIIGELEKKLPASPFSSGEWKELDEGKNLTKYLPLTSLEKYIPILFGMIYIMTGIFILLFME